jgi:hypothetical protein
MTDNEKPGELKIIFAPGAFDNFEGTQEELDQFVAEIQRLVDTGEIFEKSRPLNIDEIPEEELEKLAPFLFKDDDETFDDVEESIKDTRRLN